MVHGAGRSSEWHGRICFWSVKLTRVKAGFVMVFFSENTGDTVYSPILFSIWWTSPWWWWLLLLLLSTGCWGPFSGRPPRIRPGFVLALRQKKASQSGETWERWTGPRLKGWNWKIYGFDAIPTWKHGGFRYLGCGWTKYTRFGVEHLWPQTRWHKKRVDRLKHSVFFSSFAFV